MSECMCAMKVDCCDSVTFPITIHPNSVFAAVGVLVGCEILSSNIHWESKSSPIITSIVIVCESRNCVKFFLINVLIYSYCNCDW